MKNKITFTTDSCKFIPCSKLIKADQKNMIEDQALLIKCRELIEKKLGWGNSTSWQSSDFENLSDRIFDETKVVLSASTLKRIWGKVQYNSTPNLNTLNTLARFAGFPNWRSFANSFSESSEKAAPVTIKNLVIKTGIAISIAACLLLIGFLFFKQSGKKLTYSHIHFSSSPVTSGVPNTVVFKYDASHSNADSVFIQQNWDPKRRFKVDKDKHEYTSIYYMPGYYRAKLILNDVIVEEHDVFIESADWIGLLSKEPIPVYLPENVYKHDTWLGITEADLKNDSNDYYAPAPLFILSHVSRSYTVPSKSFSLNLELQNTYSQLNAPCKETNIMLLGTDGVINIPLSATGCISDLRLRLGEVLIEGTTNDLSKFGVDFTKPIQLSCISESDKIRIDLNGKTAYEGVFNKGIGKIVGARISFRGTGYIKSFELKNTG